MKWRCEWCGKPHADNDPPCDNCGHSSFERAVVPMGPESTEGSTRPVWVCPECGREHEKHSPPCSRCGNATLEQREREYDGVETVGSTGYLDILDRRYTAGFAAVGVLLLVLGLGAAGVVDVPGIGTPSPPDAPGSAEEWRGLPLAERLVGSGGSLSGDSIGSTLAPAAELSRVGVDVHAGPADDLYVTVVAC